MRPEESRFVRLVEVDASDSALQITCHRCSTIELVLLEPDGFDAYVERFMSHHPSGCRRRTRELTVE